MGNVKSRLRNAEIRTRISISPYFHFLMFGQLVIGPPGSGKSTWCSGVQQYAHGSERKVILVNLDPANENLPYTAAVDVRDLICLEDVMRELDLGPNGGIIYCMEYLEKNMDWLKERLDALGDSYVLFDCPGQAELYTHHSSMPAIIELIQKWSYRITAVHLVDSHHCTDPTKFISVVLCSLTTMLHLNLPHVNVLSKMDLLKKSDLRVFFKWINCYSAFDLSYFLDVCDLEYLVELLDQDSFASQYKALNAAMCDIIQNFALVSFVPLAIEV